MLHMYIHACYMYKIVYNQQKVSEQVSNWVGFPKFHKPGYAIVSFPSLHYIPLSWIWNERETR